MDMNLALADLDKHASEFNFPVLDNAYMEMAAARMTAFRGGDQWVIAFEVLGYSTNEGAFVNDLYAFGSSLGKEGFISSTSVMSQSPNDPMIDPLTEAWIADWEKWSIVVKGRAYQFCPSHDEYKSQGLEVASTGGPGSLAENQVMRFFISKETARELFMEEPDLRRELNLSSEMTIFVQTEDWQHPDVAGEEKPSENISIRSLLMALNHNSPGDFSRGRPNTNWKSWASTSQHS